MYEFFFLPLSAPFSTKYPDKTPLVEINGKPVPWKFSETSRLGVRVSSSIGLSSTTSAYSSCRSGNS